MFTIFALIVLFKGVSSRNPFMTISSIYFLIFSLASLLFSFDFIGVYKNLDSLQITNVFFNSLFNLLLFIFLIIFSINSKNKSRSFIVNIRNEKTILSFSKLLAVLIFLLNYYSLSILSNKLGMGIFEMYLWDPYYVELNFSSNVIIGNLMKLNLFNFTLLIYFFIKGSNLFKLSPYLILSTLSTMAPNTKGDYLIVGSSALVLYILIKQPNLPKLLFSGIFFVTFGFSVFVFTYFFYSEVGIEIDSLYIFYRYLTGPIAGSAFLSYSGFKSIFDIGIFEGIFDKLNLLELNGIPKHPDNFFIGDYNIGNVSGFFNVVFKDFSFIGVFVFILSLSLFLKFLVIISKYNRTLLIVYFSIVFSLILLSFFGNYLFAPVFIEITASLILTTFGIYFLKQLK